MLMGKQTTRANTHLDAMRGLAALIVVLGHTRGLFFSSLTTQSNVAEIGKDGSNSSLVEHLTIGHEAVMVFFVLSGYFVGGSVLTAFATDSWRWSDYLVKRLVRLWIVLIPAILIGTVLDSIGFHFLMNPGSIYSAPLGQDFVGPDFAAHGFDVWTLIGNMFFLQGILVPTSGTNIALWSLSNEFWYYMIFPMCLIVLKTRARPVNRIFAGLFAIGALALIGAHAAYLFIVWCLGTFVALTPRIISSRFAGMAVFGATPIFIIAFLMLKKLNLPLHFGEMTSGILTALLIYLLKCQDASCESSLYHRIAHFLSKISYTLYLTHVPFLVLLCSMVNSPWQLWSPSPAKLAEFIAVPSLAIAWAWILWQLFECRTDAARRLVWSAIQKGAGMNGPASSGEKRIP